MAEDWRPQAACIGLPPSLFFADSGFESQELTRQAKAVCATCPVADECLEEVRANGSKEDWGEWGVRGGLSPKERRALGRTPPARVKVHQVGTEAGARAHRRRGEEVCDECRHARSQARAARKARQAS